MTYRRRLARWLLGSRFVVLPDDGVFVVTQTGDASVVVTAKSLDMTVTNTLGLKRFGEGTAAEFRVGDGRVGTFQGTF